MAPRTDIAGNKAVARAAGLHYVVDGEPGLSRIASREDVRLSRREGTPRSRRANARQDSIARHSARVEDVWICARADGHLQATGRDARGRKQHRYHPEWTAARHEAKYGQMIDFARALPAIRKRVQADLKTAPLSRAHVLATVVMLLEKTLIRIGNKEYARANKSFGLTTLLDQHVQIKGASVTFHFRAKSGVMQTIEVNDAALARIVKRCRRMPGEALFQYVDADGKRQCVDSTAVNAYLREITGRSFTAKNFRTWAGTVLAAKAVCDLPGVHVGHGVQAEHRARGRCGRGEAGQHPRRLPRQLHPSGRVRGIQGGRDDRGRRRPGRGWPTCLRMRRLCSRC